jgi:hypothetical protein
VRGQFKTCSGGMFGKVIAPPSASFHWLRTDISSAQALSP